VLMFLSGNQQKEGKMEIEASLEGHDEKQKQ
jgi:hypothetical protein